MSYLYKEKKETKTSSTWLHISAALRAQQHPAGSLRNLHHDDDITRR